ncbi:hypothetical protein [Paenibacillus silviterrae]|uniref:hypothetical protein n=1 Tax=Paenibacillus silviterrae TaxID=3242194 RepID=UPI002543DE3F|nr:hypothetical protein [Paenibacillus chinjuensis]
MRSRTTSRETGIGVGQEERDLLLGGKGQEDDHFLPPRKTVHPTERERWIRIFYRTLLWLFILLVCGMLFWGWQLVRSSSGS